jgi:hypothetical protein
VVISLARAFHFNAKKNFTCLLVLCGSGLKLGLRVDEKLADVRHDVNPIRRAHTVIREREGNHGNGSRGIPAITAFFVVAFRDVALKRSLPIECFSRLIFERFIIRRGSVAAQVRECTNNTDLLCITGVVEDMPVVLTRGANGAINHLLRFGIETYADRRRLVLHYLRLQLSAVRPLSQKRGFRDRHAPMGSEACRKAITSVQKPSRNQSLTVCPQRAIIWRVPAKAGPGSMRFSAHRAEIVPAVR